MGSKGRVPPPHHVRRPLPGGGIVHPDAFGLGPRGPRPFPAFDMLPPPPPQVLEHKLAGQHVEIQRLATENQRLAATHVTLRQELAAAQHELQMVHNDIGAFKAEREHQMRGLVDKIAKMEAELKSAEPVRLELQQARTEAEKLVVTRQELMAKVHKLTQDLHRAHVDVQQVPFLVSELDGLRQEYEQCRVSFDYEKKLFSDHRESLQAMENNYVTMAREVEKLRLELTNTANVEMRTVAGGPYGAATGNNDNETSVRPVGQNNYEDGYAVAQMQGHNPMPGNSGSAVAATASASTIANAGVGAGTPTYPVAQSGSAPTKSAFDAPRGPNYQAAKVPGYDPSRGPVYDASRGAAYDASRGHGYDAQRGPGYDLQQRVPGYDPYRVPGYPPRGPGYDAQQGPHYDVTRVAGYDPSARISTAPPHVQTAHPNSAPFGSATPPTRAGTGNPVRR